MSFEIFTIENWLYNRLATDATLANLLAADNKAPFYQQGIYSHMAPEIDPRSLQSPEFPLVVFQRVGSRGSDDTTICGNRILVQPIYQIGTWDHQYGAVSTSNIQAIANRVDDLLNNVVCGTTPAAWCRRMDTNTLFEYREDGRVDIGVIGTYVFQIQS